LVDNAKHAAHDVSVKAQELKESAGEKLQAAEQIGKYYLICRFFSHILSYYLIRRTKS